MKRRVTLLSATGAGFVGLLLAGCSQGPTTLTGPVGIVKQSVVDDSATTTDDQPGQSDDVREVATVASVATKTIVLSVPGMH